jgi:hypothetical protein
MRAGRFDAETLARQRRRSGFDDRFHLHARWGMSAGMLPWSLIGKASRSESVRLRWAAQLLGFLYVELSLFWFGLLNPSCGPIDLTSGKRPPSLRNHEEAGAKLSIDT